MKASDFCNFFEFSYEKEHGYADDEWYQGEYNYKATDNQGCFHDRYANDVTEFANEFNSLLQDYVDDTIENYDFVPLGEKSYYEEALEWIEHTELKDTDTHEVIKVLVNPDLLEEG